jgi:hypothetical protein
MWSLACAMDEAKQQVGLEDQEANHRRGGYHCVNTGLSMGGRF